MTNATNVTTNKMALTRGASTCLGAVVSRVVAGTFDSNLACNFGARGRSSRCSLPFSFPTSALGRASADWGCPAPSVVQLHRFDPQSAPVPGQALVFQRFAPSPGPRTDNLVRA